MIRKDLPLLSGSDISQICDQGRRWYDKGHEWATLCCGKTKHAALIKTAEHSRHYDYDLKRTLMALKFNPNEKIIRLIRKDMSDKDFQSYLEKQTFSANRFKLNTASHNLYVHGAIRKWQEEGIKLVKRIEIMHDEKTCPLCRVMNGKTYEIGEVALLDLPLTADTHPHCRGTFIPVMNSITKDPSLEAIVHVVNMESSNGAKIENVPIEYKPFLTAFLKKVGQIPFDINFDPSATSDYRFTNDLLTINPKTLDDEDPREIISQHKAKKLWPKYKDKFKIEYGALLKLGLVHPRQSATSWEELFEKTYSDYMLNLLDEPYEVMWCQTNLKVA